MILSPPPARLQNGLTTIALAEAGGITQFGFHLQSLAPGAQSSTPHWHSAEDEMAYLLDGTPTLCEAEETRLEPGMVLAWPKGAGPAHALRNDGPGVARYLVVGTRAERDRIHQPDHDLLTEKRGPLRRYCHSDGRPRA